MKRPKSFRVMGIRIPIRYSDKPFDVNGSLAAGFYDPAKRSIHICTGQSEILIQETLFHELGHALLDICGLNQTSLGHDLQELIVEQYSKFIHENFVQRKSRRCRK